jgi:hypothetical protein
MGLKEFFVYKKKVGELMTISDGITRNWSLTGNRTDNE